MCEDMTLNYHFNKLNKCKLSFRCLDVAVLSQVVGRLLKSIRFSITILSETVFFKSKRVEKIQISEVFKEEE